MFTAAIFLRDDVDCFVVGDGDERGKHWVL